MIVQTNKQTDKQRLQLCIYRNLSSSCRTVCYLKWPKVFSEITVNSHSFEVPKQLQKVVQYMYMQTLQSTTRQYNKWIISFQEVFSKIQIWNTEIWNLSKYDVHLLCDLLPQLFHFRLPSCFYQSSLLFYLYNLRIKLLSLKSPHRAEICGYRDQYLISFFVNLNIIFNL